MDPGVEMIAAQVRSALEAADLDGFADLLDPNVRWGAPGDSSPPCRSRAQVLDWYRRGRAEGRRARVVDVVARGDRILVSTTVTPRRTDADAAEADRWQVLTVAGGRVVDIRGYDSADEAAAAAGL